MKFKKIIFIILILVLQYYVNAQELKGKLYSKEDKFSYILNSKEVKVFNKLNNIIFYRKITDKNTYYLNINYNPYDKLFYLIKQQKTDKGNIYIIENNSGRQESFILKEKFIYSPNIINLNGNRYLIFIDDDFSIQIYNINTKKYIKKIKFDTSIYGLRVYKNKIFLNIFIEGKYRKIGYKIKDLFYNFQNDISFEIKKVKQINPNSDITFNKDKIFINMILDYRKFTGFGDSITYGTINHQKIPELGYIPRLNNLLNNNLYESTVINEGIPGETTFRAVERIDNVLLKHKAKFLLFHEGTNDSIFLELPVSGIIFNIRYIMNHALEYNVKPIITTLIPKNGFWGSKIYRERSIEINKGIKQISDEIAINLIDFFNIFLNYPSNDGGYLSLMSDNLHPSEKGYQLMAEKWFEIIKGFPPTTPKIISKKIVKKSNKIGIKIYLNSIPDPDFSYYKVYYGTNENKINSLYGMFKTNEISIFLPYNKKYYIGVKAVDTTGNESNLSNFIDFYFLKLFF
jgi:lysophospholipase L1-like esterase